jgi:hypothetical protein
MIDAQQQYIKLNIHGEVSIIVGQEKRDMHINVITCLCVSLLSFHMVILLYQHGQSALDPSRTLFLLASTQGASYRLVMNHLIYEYVLSHPPTPPRGLFFVCFWVNILCFI